MDRTQCDAIVVSAMALLDGERVPIDRAEIDRHVLSCRRCASEIETLRSLAERLAPMSRVTVHGDCWPAVPCVSLPGARSRQRRWIRCQCGPGW